MVNSGSSALSACIILTLYHFMFSHCGVFTSVYSVAFSIKAYILFIPRFTEDVEFLGAGGGEWRG